MQTKNGSNLRIAHPVSFPWESFYGQQGGRRNGSKVSNFISNVSSQKVMAQRTRWLFHPCGGTLKSRPQAEAVALSACRVLAYHAQWIRPPAEYRINGAWWCTSVIPALGRLEDQDCRVFNGHMSLRSDWGHWDLVSWGGKDHLWVLIMGLVPTKRMLLI